MNDQERGIAESFGQVLADRNIEIKKLRLAIEIILRIDGKKNPHLERARYSGLSQDCIGCIGYIVTNDGCFGESFTLKDLEEKLDSLKGAS